MSAQLAARLLLLSLLTATHAHAGCSCSRRAVMQGAAAAAAGGLWYPGKASAMVGGGLVSQGELDGLGLVGLATAAGGVCTGTRIGDGLVLTARHCTCSRAGPLEHAAFSGDLFAKNAVVRPIEDVITDEDGDLAIIRFKGHAPSSHKSATLQLSGLEVADGDVAPLMVYGYGRALADGPGASGDSMGVLRKLPNRLLGPVYGQPMTLTTSPASSTEGQCFGDSGGPAFLARPIRPGVAEIRAQVGVLSQVGAGDGWCGGALDRYVNLAAHVEWIDDAVASLGGSRLLRV